MSLRIDHDADEIVFEPLRHREPHRHCELPAGVPADFHVVAEVNEDRLSALEGDAQTVSRGRGRDSRASP